MNYIFDIETGPLPSEQLAKLMPEIKAPSNYKDLAKIEAYIAEAATEWLEKAALSAMTGRVLAIGIWSYDQGARVYGHDNESEILNWFWDRWEHNHQDSKWIGFCIKSFDLPFLVQRSWINKVRIPFDVLTGRYFHESFVDLQELWLCFNRTTSGASLDSICKACGLGQKSGNGKDFAKLWDTDRDAAMEYLKTDLRLTASLAQRLGL